MFNSVERLGGYCILLVWVAVLIGLWQLRYCFFSGFICFGLWGLLGTSCFGCGCVLLADLLVI